MAFPVQKYRNMREHEFDVEIVTPLFSGGAGRTEAELRVSALKGMIRFWWRAVYGNDDIKKMKEDEAKIFGDTGRKSDLIIALYNTDQCRPVKENIHKGRMIPVDGKKFSVSIVEYLAYGLFDQSQKKYLREHYEPGTSFSILMCCSVRNEHNILNCFRMLHQFGSLGSRSRNGLGGIKIKKFSGKNPERELHDIATGPRKEFSSFSKDTKLFLFKEQSTWDKALSDIGVAYRIAKISLENKHQDARRQLIASPIDVKNHRPVNSRHAKPYFLHVHKMENGSFRGQILFLPYQYHEPAKRVEYNKACQDMNQTIKKADNFVKEISATTEGV